MLGWRISRSGFVTLIVGEVSLGPLNNTHHLSLASIATNEVVAGWCITKRVNRLVGNEIELGMKIPTIESRASNIPMTKGTMYVVMLLVMWEPIWASRFRYWLLTGDVSQSCLHSSRTRRVRTLNVRWRYSIIWVMYVGNRMLFEVPNEIMNMTRNSEMVRR